MYNFIKIKLKNIPLEDWFLQPTSLEQVSEHWEKYVLPGLKKCYDDNSGCDVHKFVSGLLQMTNQPTMKNEFDQAIKDYKKRRLESYDENKELLLMSGGQSLQLPRDVYTVTETITTDELEFPF